MREGHEIIIELVYHSPCAIKHRPVVCLSSLQKLHADKLGTDKVELLKESGDEKLSSLDPAKVSLWPPSQAMWASSHMAWEQYSYNLC